MESEVVVKRKVEDAPSGRVGPAPMTDAVSAATLVVGRSDDPAEREADRVAAQVVRQMSAGGPGPSFPGMVASTRTVRAARRESATTGGSGGAVKRSVEGPSSTRVARAASTDAVRVPMIRRKSEGVREPSVQGTVSSTRAVRAVRRESTTGASVGVVGPAGGPVGPHIAQQIDRVRRGGQPLEAGVRRSMEDAFGADLGRVRLHEGTGPAALNQALGARAFTVGSDIFFGAGIPDAASTSGRHLLAHELTHTLQNGSAGSVARTIRRAPVQGGLVQDPTALGGEGAAEGASAEASEGAGAEGEVIAEGATAPVELPVEQVVSTGPPPGLVADTTSGSTGAASPLSHRTAGDTGGGAATPTTFRIQVSDFSDATRLSSSSTIPIASQSDAVAAKVAAKSSVKGGASVSPFGALNSRYNTSSVKWKAKKAKTGGTISLGFTLKLDSSYGTSDAGRTDVKSASSSAVTADNYQDVVDDLTPLANLGSWVAPRNQFWSQKICERHEKFHFKDVSKWFSEAGRKLVLDDLNGKSISVAAGEGKESIDAKVQQLVQSAIVTVTNGHILHMNGTGVPYYDYPGEIRAFGDGKAPYEKLAAGVKKHGEKLVKKRDKAAPKSKA